MEKFTIISVEIVSGTKLNSSWRYPMQIITTDKGEYIDNMPGRQFGCYKDANSGFDWKTKIGGQVDGARIIDYGGYKWINM